MKQIIKLGIGSLLIAFLLSSCAGTYTANKLRTTSFMPDRVEMKLTLDDFEFIKDTEVSVTYSTYLLGINVLREINEKEASKRTVNSISTYGRTWMPISRNLERALYDVKQDLPEAEIFIPVSEVVETEKMFLGRKVKKTLTVRAYKLRK